MAGFIEIVDSILSGKRIKSVKRCSPSSSILITGYPDQADVSTWTGLNCQAAGLSAIDTIVVDTTIVDTTIVDNTIIDTTIVDNTIIDTTIVDTIAAGIGDFAVD